MKQYVWLVVCTSENRMPLHRSLLRLVQDAAQHDILDLEDVGSSPDRANPDDAAAVFGDKAPDASRAAVSASSTDPLAAGLTHQPLLQTAIVNRCSACPHQQSAMARLTPQVISSCNGVEWMTMPCPCHLSGSLRREEHACILHQPCHELACSQSCNTFSADYGMLRCLFALRGQALVH